MSNSNTNPDSINAEFDKPLLPSGLNILTILTFIGSGIQLIFVLLGFVNAQKSYDEKDKTLSMINSDEAPGWVKAMMPTAENYEKMVTQSLDNKIPLFILGLTAIILCIYGAMQMRKLKKSGFSIYLVGQLLPLVTTAFFIGFFVFSGATFIFLNSITILFILLYLTQLKHLVY
jgi:hypothetical protein